MYALTLVLALVAQRPDSFTAGVREYIVAALRTQQIYWFIRRRGKFRELTPGADGIYRSEVFPGLWLDATALLAGDLAQVLAVLNQGIASPSHQAFIAQLAAQRHP